MFTEIRKLICADVQLLFSNNHCPKLLMQKFSRDLATVYIHTILRYVNFADGTKIFHVFSFTSSLHTVWTDIENVGVNKHEFLQQLGLQLSQRCKCIIAKCEMMPVLGTIKLCEFKILEKLHILLGGMANQLGKFSRHLANLTHPLRGLLSSKQAWLWGPEQDMTFSQVKEELAKPTILALYQPGNQTKISADASSYGLGAILLQHTADTWKPVAYASRALSETQKRYAQIEKEVLAVTWACTKFTDYLLGCKFAIESDHKPLILLLNTKHLDSLPPQILRFRLRLAKFDYSVCHVPGKLLYTADTLSRVPASPVAPSEDDFLQDSAVHLQKFYHRLIGHQ